MEVNYDFSGVCGHLKKTFDHSKFGTPFKREQQHRFTDIHEPSMDKIYSDTSIVPHHRYLWRLTMFSVESVAPEKTVWTTRFFKPVAAVLGPML